MGFSKQSAGREIESKNIPRVMSSMKGDSCTGTLRLSQGVESQQSHLSIPYIIKNVLQRVLSALVLFSFCGLGFWGFNLRGQAQPFFNLFP